MHPNNHGVAALAAALAALFVCGICQAQDEPGATKPPPTAKALPSSPGPQASRRTESAALRPAPTSLPNLEACLATHRKGPTLATIRQAVIRQAGVSRDDVRGAMLGERFRGLLPKLQSGPAAARRPTSARTCR